MIGAKEAMIELLRRAAQGNLLAFLQYVWWMPSPLHIGRHTREICARLTRAVEDFRRGIDTYLIISLPFRHGKSDIASRAFPAYFLGRCADMQPNVLMSGYGSSLVKGFSSNVQSIVEGEAYARLFPGMKIDPEKNATDEWRIKDSVSSVYAQGLGGSITGKGANLIIVDDFFKNAEEAGSQTVRDKVWESFRTDICTRTNAPAHIIIVIGTRWHVDDLIGRIYEEMKKNPDFPRFESLVYPAHKDGPDGWETLFPEHYRDSWYAMQRSQLGPYQAAALLDCDPRRAGKTVFRREWLEYYTGEIDWRQMRIIILVDGAKSKKKTSDYTCIQVWGRNRDGRSYLLDGVHARLNLDEKIKELFRLVERFGGPRKVDCVWWEQVGPMSDVEALRIEMDRRLYHFTVRELRHNTNKDFRIMRLVVPFAKRDIVLPLRMVRTRIVEPGDGRPPETQVYDLVQEMVEDELMLYTGDQTSILHDDMIDCMADLTDEEVLAQFTPPEGGETQGEAFRRERGKQAGDGLFGR
ncbi:MAG: terminase family protein [Kiritimatiellae bacterium]|nr:terminase family protein [Kiritimatiellia bacterium]